MSSNKWTNRIGRAFLLAALAAAPALAVEVSYQTTGTFLNCAAGFGCAGNILTGANNLKISFAGTAADFPNVDVPPVTNAPFGTFTTTGPTTGTDGSGTNFIANFDLKITQLAPAPGGTETLVGDVTGNIKIANSQIFVEFTSGTGGAGNAVADVDPVTGQPALRFTFLDPTGTTNVTYWVVDKTKINPQGGTTANPGKAGTTDINGSIDSTVPEPTFYALSGIGFAGLLFMAIQRRRQKA